MVEYLLPHGPSVRELLVLDHPSHSTFDSVVSLSMGMPQTSVSLRLVIYAFSLVEVGIGNC